MLKLYKASVDFMINESRMLGPAHPNKLASQNARVKHFITNLRLVPKDVDDSAAAMNELQQETLAFTAEQRTEMAAAISAHMSTDSAVDKAGNHDRQSHMFLQNYLPDTKWKILYDKTETLNKKLETLVDFCLETLGLRHPDDSTLKILIAIALLCHGTDLTPDEFYDKFGDVKDMFTEKRPLIPGKSLMATYDRAPEQFMRLFPRQYLECDPPIASRLDERSIQQKTRKGLMPTRSTNKKLERNKGASKSTAAKDVNTEHGNSSTVNRCLDYILGQKGAAPPVVAPKAILDAPAVPPAANVGAASPTLAITYPGFGPQAGAGQAPPTIDSILEQARQTLAMKAAKAAAGGKGKKGKKRNDKLPSSEDDDDEAAKVDELL